jgi:hypothetical protein
VSRITDALVCSVEEVAIALRPAWDTDGTEDMRKGKRFVYRHSVAPGFLAPYALRLGRKLVFRRAGIEQLLAPGAGSQVRDGEAQ